MSTDPAVRDLMRDHWYLEEIRRKDAALDAGIDALTKLSKTGSLRKDFREETIRQMQEARNERLF